MESRASPPGWTGETPVPPQTKFYSEPPAIDGTSKTSSPSWNE